MKFTEFAARIRFFTGTNTVTFTDADILMLANTAKDDFAKDIVQANEDYFGLDHYCDLVAGQREYPLPLNLLQLKLTEAKLDGTTWKRLIETDYNLGTYTTDEDSIVVAFAGQEPCFEYYRNSIWILNDSAIIDVADGLYIKGFIYPADFTSLSSTDDMSANPSSTSHGLPRQFHELLARRIIIDYKNAKDKPIPLTERETLFDRDFADAIESIKNPNLDRSITGKVPYNDGSQY
jgi:hypothetical protein